MKYVIISPVRNEERYIEKTILSVIGQVLKPQEWIIVNDGSTDSTEEIVKKYSQRHRWIKLINRGDRGYRYLGPGVVEVFNLGFKSIKAGDYDFVVKMDCDLSFEKDYFERIARFFSENPRLGMVS